MVSDLLIPADPPESTEATQPPSYASTRAHHRCCLIIPSHERMRFTGFPQSLEPDLRETIMPFWPRGLEEFRGYTEMGLKDSEKWWEYKFAGKPFQQVNSDFQKSQPLLISLLSALSEKGYELEASLPLKNTLVFRPAPPRARRFVTISLSDGDKARLCFEDGQPVRSPSKAEEAGDERPSVPGVEEAFTQVMQTWSKSVQSTSLGPTVANLPGSFLTLLVKLKGSPFQSGSSDNEVCAGARFVCGIYEGLDRAGWEMKANLADLMLMVFAEK